MTDQRRFAAPEEKDMVPLFREMTSEIAFAVKDVDLDDGEIADVVVSVLFSGEEIRVENLSATVSNGVLYIEGTVANDIEIESEGVGDITVTVPDGAEAKAFIGTGKGAFRQ